MIQDAEAVTLGCMQGCPDEGHQGPHLVSGFLPIGTQSCLILPTGCTSTHPMGRSPRPRSWTESHSTPRTMYTRPPSWLLTMVCPTVTRVLGLWAGEGVVVRGPAAPRGKSVQAAMNWQLCQSMLPLILLPSITQTSVTLPKNLLTHLIMLPHRVPTVLHSWLVIRVVRNLGMQWRMAALASQLSHLYPSDDNRSAVLHTVSWHPTQERQEGLCPP